jgi:hypothetical protein
MKYTSSSSAFYIRHDTLFSLHDEIIDLLSFATENLSHSTALLFDGYKNIKAVKKMFDYLVRYKFDSQKLEERVRESIQRLHLLFRWLRDDEQQDRELRRLLSSLLEKLRGLLPQDAMVQLWLFDKNTLEDTPEEKCVLPGFFAWKKQRCRARLVFHDEMPFVRPRSPFQQLSLPLWKPPVPQELLNISLRQARRLARALGLPQKQAGQDFNLPQFIAQFQQQWWQNASRVMAAMEAG